MSNVWFITGAGRGMGVDIAKAALAAEPSDKSQGLEVSGVVEVTSMMRSHEIIESQCSPGHPLRGAPASSHGDPVAAGCPSPRRTTYFAQSGLTGKSRPAW